MWTSCPKTFEACASLHCAVCRRCVDNAFVSLLTTRQRSVRALFSEQVKRARASRNTQANCEKVFVACKWTALDGGKCYTKGMQRIGWFYGGTSIWLLAWTAVAGWPLTALALLPFYTSSTVPTRLTWGLMMAYMGLGLLSAIDNLLYSWAYLYLPASTASLISASSLPFTAIFAYFLLGKGVTASIFNSIGVIPVATIILALDSSSDRPSGVSNMQYALGFLLDVAGSAIHGLIFTLSELIFIKYLGRESIHVILEQQAMVSIVGFAFTTVGVLASGDFSVMVSEAEAFMLGSVGYYMVLLWSTITLQVGLLGSVAVMYSASALLAGVLNAMVVPVTSIGAVICVNDPIDGFKIVALVLTAWGFGSYIYGGFKEAQAVESDTLSEPLGMKMVSESVSDYHEIEQFHKSP